MKEKFKTKLNAKLNLIHAIFLHALCMHKNNNTSEPWFTENVLFNRSYNYFSREVERVDVFTCGLVCLFNALFKETNWTGIRIKMKLLPKDCFRTGMGPIIRNCTG